MAAVTVTRRRTAIEGSRRVVTATVNIAADLDTFVTGLRLIEAADATPSQSSLSQIGMSSVAGGTITFKVGGAENNVLVRAEGY